LNKTRQQLIDEAKRLSAELGQIFLDVEHWNRIHPEETPIDPDPEGELGRMKKSLDRGIERESRRN
jgi:hypothetical protein